VGDGTNEATFDRSTDLYNNHEEHRVYGAGCTASAPGADLEGREIMA